MTKKKLIIMIIIRVYFMNGKIQRKRKCENTKKIRKKESQKVKLEHVNCI